MSDIANLKLDETTERQGVAHKLLEQRAPEIRWRIEKFPMDLPSLEGEIVGLGVGATQVAILFGQLAGSAAGTDFDFAP